MARPGIMLYFEILEPIMALSDADKGRLLVAILEYGQSGVVPEFDGMLALAWSFVRPLIDKDGERYEDMKLQREYATFCKKRKRIWMPKISFDDWVLMTDNERQRAVDPVGSRTSSDNEPFRPDNERQRAVSSRYPTTTNNDNVQLQSQKSIYSDNVQLQPSISNNNAQLQAVDGGDGQESKVTVFGGELGKNVVFLSPAQIADLLDTMGLETFDYYVDKLSNFIIKNGASVKNHYDTILKWWQEDGAITKRKRKKEIPKGASGKLGKAELESLQQMLAED